MKTIKEVREAKSKLEQEIAVLISQFEQDKSVDVSDLRMNKTYICTEEAPVNAKCVTIKATVEV